MAISQQGRCFYCGEPVGAKATVDHFIPQCYGGIDDIANTVLAHRRCNILKGDRLPTPDEIEALVEQRRRAKLPVWPPILALLDAEEGRNGSWWRGRWRQRGDGRGSGGRMRIG